MNRDDIIRMAREAGFVMNEAKAKLCYPTPKAAGLKRMLERFAALVAAAEREACAKVCDEEGLLWGQRYAAAIRARGEQK